jgi:hypothetical protein
MIRNLTRRRICTEKSGIGTSLDGLWIFIYLLTTPTYIKRQ